MHHVLQAVNASLLSSNGIQLCLLSLSDLVSADGRNYSQRIMHIKQLTLLYALCLPYIGLLAMPAHAGILPEDSSAAAIYSYSRISDNDDDALSYDSFLAQIAEITSGGYNVQPLAALLNAQILPRHSIALTFDSIDYVFVRDIAPLLIEKRLPFTVFVSPGQIDAGKGVRWDDIRTLVASDLVTVGLSAYTYAHIADWPLEKLTEDLNHSKERLREELKQDVRFFAYPYGEYSPAYVSLIERQGFTAAFGQHSGVIYKGADPLTLPRFTMTEEFADLDRLRMTSQALPFPVRDLEPDSMILKSNPPFPGFTAPSAIQTSELKKMMCFASGVGQLTIQLLGHNRVEIRFPKGFDDSRARVNCTLPVPSADDPRDVRWRWLGFLYSVPDKLINPERP